jgi:3-carboxy-cis,cis-muconate cycloisomerase
MVKVELAWMHALADCGAAKPDHVEAVERAAAGWQPDLAARDVEDAANPALPLVRGLRARVSDPDGAALLHAGLTSQDTLDTALMLVARDALERIDTNLGRASSRLAELADEHRSTVMAGRTLTQYAVPITFGLTAAQWLTAVLEATEEIAGVCRRLPVQCGGAAGTLARAADLLDEPTRVASAFADQLGLVWPGLPWHTRRTPVTRLGDALVRTCDALGVVAADVLILGRPEIAEVREGSSPDRGASSTMPHKQNPVLSVLVHSASLQAPQLGAQLHLDAARSIDERPDGAWHAEWPSLRRLMELALVASSQATELLDGLEVDPRAMERRAREAADQLLAERGGTGEPGEYLGAAGSFIDTSLVRYRGEPDGA